MKMRMPKANVAGVDYRCIFCYRFNLLKQKKNITNLRRAKLFSHQKVKMIKIHVVTCIIFLYLCYHYDRAKKAWRVA